MYKTLKTVTLLSILFALSSTSIAMARCEVYLINSKGFMAEGTQAVSAYCQINEDKRFYPVKWYGCENSNGDTVWGYVNYEGLSALTKAVQEFGAMAASSQGSRVVCGGYKSGN